MHRITNMSSHNHSLFKLSINNQSLTSDCIPADTCSTAFWTFSWSSCSLTSQRKTSSGFCCRASPRPQRAQRCEGCGAGFSMRKLLEQCGAVLDTGKQRRGRPTDEEDQRCQLTWHLQLGFEVLAVEEVYCTGFPACTQPLPAHWNPILKQTNLEWTLRYRCI